MPFRGFMFTTGSDGRILRKEPRALRRVNGNNRSESNLPQKTRFTSVSLGAGYYWLDTGTQTSLLEAANYIATIEHRQGLKVACLEEVALRVGFIDRMQMDRLIDQRPKGEYRDYLRVVAEEESPSLPGLASAHQS
jgi:hypothetical protein